MSLRIRSKQTINQILLLQNHRLLLIKGPDAFSFLQGQVTCDIDLLRPSKGQLERKSCLGAHCSPKGRALFSFFAASIDEQTIALVLHKSTLTLAYEQLKKYSVFSKVELLFDASHSLITCTTESLTQMAPTFAQDLSHSVSFESAFCQEESIFLPMGNNLWQCWLASSGFSLQGFKKDLEVKSDNGEWDAALISRGIAEVRSETSAEFVPQMLNFHQVGHGISFSKGCYTGQEVIARTHYLGSVKRKLFRFSVPPDVELLMGDALYSRTNDPTSNSPQAIGQVVLYSGFTQEILSVCEIKAADSGPIFADKDCQHSLTQLALPYAITE